MRCFISIDLPKEVQEELSRVEEELKKENAQLILVNPKNIHLTIKFLGEIDDSQIKKVKEALSKLQFSKFKAKLSSLGVFPSLSSIRVIWADAEPKKNFKEIHDTVDKILFLEGFKTDEKWENHATLARVKWIKDKKAFSEKLQKIKLKPIEFVVKDIKLKKSTLTPKVIYEDIMSVGLK